MKILCFGDSNTYGFDPRSFLGGQYPSSCRWVDLLAEKLNCQTINTGENGRKIPEKPGELREFRRLLDAVKPVDLMIVMLGTNDLLQGQVPAVIARNMESFLQCIDLDRSKILLVCPPPLRFGEWVFDQHLIDASADLYLEYKAIANRLQICFADAGQWNIQLTFDGVHFSEEGHRVFASGLCRFIDSHKVLPNQQKEKFNHA